MKCVFNINISDNDKKKKYNLHAVLERKFLNLLSGSNPYYVSISINDRNDVKK
jgi:hypothetical protein